MKNLVEQLSNYAEYHRDPRNIATHFIGVPVIVLAVFILLSKPSIGLAGVSLSPALVLFLVSSVFYFRLSIGYGLAMFLVHGVLLLTATSMAMLPTVQWLLSGVGLFVVGWIIQFIGHFYEGRKPAFVDDLIGLAIGPLFVVAELGFLIGLGHKTKAAVESNAGPVRRREVNGAQG